MLFLVSGVVPSLVTFYLFIFCMWKVHVVASRVVNILSILFVKVKDTHKMYEICYKEKSDTFISESVWCSM